MPVVSERDLVWRRSSATNGECVEVASREGYLLVRDSKAPGEAVLEFRQKDWRGFLWSIKSGNLAGPPGKGSSRRGRGLK